MSNDARRFGRVDDLRSGEVMVELFLWIVGFRIYNKAWISNTCNSLQHQIFELMLLYRNPCAVHFVNQRGLRTISHCGDLLETEHLA